MADRYPRQVHEVIIRDNDGNERRPRFLHLVPIGDVLGVAITRVENEDDERPPQVKDEDLIFVSMLAFTSALPGLGLVAGPGIAVGPDNLGGSGSGYGHSQVREGVEP